MKQTKHTPGPWTVDYVRGHNRQGIPERVSFWRIASKENICIAEIDQSLDSTSKEERTANASLIGAAPLLLSALRGILLTIGPLPRTQQEEDVMRIAEKAIANTTKDLP